MGASSIIRECYVGAFACALNGLDVKLRNRRVIPPYGSRFATLVPLSFSRSRPASGRAKPPESKASFARADALRDRGEWVAAVKAYEDGLQAAPQSFPHWVQLGNVAKEAGQLDTAWLAYSHALALDANDADLHLQLGHLATRCDDNAAAQGHYERAIALGTARPGLRLALAELARDRQDWTAASTHFRAFLEEDETAGDIWVQFGHALKESGEVTRAAAAYRRGIDCGADPADAYLHLGHLHHRAGDAEQSTLYYTHALRAGSRDEHALRRARRSVLEPAVLTALERVRPGSAAPWRAQRPGRREPSFAALMLECAAADTAPKPQRP